LAAIIKPGSRVVVGKLHPDAMVEVVRRCAEVGAELLPLGEAVPYHGAQRADPRFAMYGSILAVAYSPDGHRIVTASADHTAKVWNAATGS
jgi:WD40 repeat protein